MNIYWLTEDETAIESGPHAYPKVINRYGVCVSNPQESHIRSTHGRLAPDKPVYDSATQRLGSIELLEGELLWPVTDLTAQEIADKVTADLQVERELMIVTPWQFRKAINAAGKRIIVNAALSSMTQDEQDGWHVASSFERLNPLVVKLAGELLGYNDVQIDTFFRNATKL